MSIFEKSKNEFAKKIKFTYINFPFVLGDIMYNEV